MAHPTCGWARLDCGGAEYGARGKLRGGGLREELEQRWSAVLQSTHKETEQPNAEAVASRKASERGGARTSKVAQEKGRKNASKQKRERQAQHSPRAAPVGRVKYSQTMRQDEQDEARRKGERHVQVARCGIVESLTQNAEHQGELQRLGSARASVARHLPTRDRDPSLDHLAHGIRRKWRPPVAMMSSEVNGRGTSSPYDYSSPPSQESSSLSLRHSSGIPGRR